MRVSGEQLGYLLVVLSLVLGTGGVVIRSHADSELPISPAPAIDMGDTPELTIATDLSQGACRPPQPTRRRMTLPLPQARPGEVSFTLNTRGYNYSEPGRYPPAAPVPEGTPPADLKKHAPASEAR
jgi:hypothetical protein